MRPLIPALLLVAACGSSSGSGDKRQACEMAREHLARLHVGIIAARFPKTVDPAIVERELAKHEKNLAGRGGTAHLDSCVSNRSEKWLACVLDSETAEQAKRCGDA